MSADFSVSNPLKTMFAGSSANGKPAIVPQKRKATWYQRETRTTACQENPVRRDWRWWWRRGGRIVRRSPSPEPLLVHLLSFRESERNRGNSPWTHWKPLCSFIEQIAASFWFHLDEVKINICGWYIFNRLPVWSATRRIPMVSTAYQDQNHWSEPEFKVIASNTVMREWLSK